jgi:glycolate oxidase FAD binding subunit
MTLTSAAHRTALESVMDASRMISDPTALAKYVIHGVVPGSAAKPTSAQEAAEVVRYAATEKLAVVPCGNRTKLDLGAPPLRYDIALDLSGLCEIAHYDPADLTLSADAGIPLAELNATLLQHNQFLPLLTPYYSATTIGGAIASGLDSPLRQFYGTARDFLLGAEFIDGTGAQVKSGGRVVKNVTGYDLHKLLIGSLGSLAVITRLNFRTFPAPLAGSCGFVASFPTHEAALALRRRIVESPLSPLTLDVFSPSTARIFATRSPLTPEVPVFSDESHDARESSLPLPGDWFHPQHWQLCAAFAGTPEVLHRYTRDLTRFAHDANSLGAHFLDDSARPSIWGRLREAIALFRESSRAASICRLSLLPGYQAHAITVLEGVANAADLPITFVARASGTIYVGLLPETSGGSENGQPIDEGTLEKLSMLTQEIFALVRSRNGDAAMLFAPQALRAMASVQAAQPKSSPLTPRIKSAFDPGNIFAPGRFV